MRIKFALGFFILFLVLFQSPALAQEDSDVTPTRKPTINRLQNAKERASAAASKRAEKLSQARLNVCRGRSISLHNRVKNTVNRGQKMHQRLEHLVSAVDKFYTDRLVPQGLVLENHDELLADIEAKEANVRTLLEEAKATGEEFDCESDDPKGQLEMFKTDMKEVVMAFKEYKLSVRTFVKAVKDLAAQNVEASESEVAE